MLVLTRKKGESIMIGDQIEIVMLSIEGDSVRVGLKAPKHLEIYRREIYDTIQQANQEANQSKLNITELGDLFPRGK